MNELTKFVWDHAARGECQCGSCFDKGDRPDPEGHTVDLGFFIVSLMEIEGTDRTGLEHEFVRLTKTFPHGEFTDCNPLDGSEHSYLELGAWIGDQGLAMMYMGLGTLLGVFRLLTPAILRIEKTDPLYMKMLQGGLLSVIAPPEVADAVRT